MSETNMAGFIKGTLVHTKDGLKRIEEIKVGDYVLAASDDGSGNQCFQAVLNTFVLPNKTLRAIRFYDEERDATNVFYVTGNHHFWCEGISWLKAEEIRKSNNLRKWKGNPLYVVSQDPVYRTKQEGIGWVQEIYDVEESPGFRFDFSTATPIRPDGQEHLIDPEIYRSDNPYLTTDVYNIEVEGHHTYYVGQSGALVRDAIARGASTS